MQLPAHTKISDSLTEMGVPAFELISDELGRVKKLVNEQLTDCSRSVGQLVKELNTLGGKMVRPALVLLSYQAGRDVSCKKKTQYDMRDRQDEAIRVAAIVEIIHNATLLHDDVIDEGQRRRGLPTVNSLRGNESAVLLGDFLLSKASKMRADLEPQINKIIAATTMRVCEGELRQIIQRQNRQLSESEYIDIITEKSASFFSGCCYLGGHLAEASETESHLLADFGLNVGIAFQITDDLLDIVGDESKTGKTSGSDVDRSKLTLAVIHLLKTVDEREKTAVISKLNTTGEIKEVLVETLKRYGSLEYAHSRAQQFAAKAIEALAGLKESDAKNALIETAGFIAVRAV